jgi:hypothetical protein
MEMPVLSAVKTREVPNDHRAIRPQRGSDVVSSVIRVEPEAASIEERNASTRSAAGSVAVSSSTAISRLPRSPAVPVTLGG